MHIVICSQSYPPSLWNSIGRTTYSLSQGLAALGHSVMVVTYNTALGDRFVKDKNVRVMHLGTDGQPAISLEHINLWQSKIAKFVREHCQQTDAFICVDSYSYKGIIESGVKARVVGLCNFLYNSTGWLKSIGEDVERKILEEELEFLKSVDTLLVNNTSTGLKVGHKSGRTSEKYTIGIPEIKGYKRNATKNQVLYVGKLNREKGIERLLRVMPSVEWMNLVICDQNYSSSYRAVVSKLVTELGINPSKVTYRDFIPTKEVWKLYTESELCVVPHIVEPFGYAAIYPMMLNTPVIVSTANSLPEIVGVNDCGAIFNNLDELRFYLEELHHMTPLQEMYSTNAKEKVLTEHTLEKMVQSVLCHL